MKKHFANAAYGVLDYVSYPLGMLLVAPAVLHKLGASEYGLWMIATAVISAGGILASGFCDANLQRVAHHRGTGATKSIIHAVRSMMGIDLVLGLALSALAWTGAPYAAHRIAVSPQVSQGECLVALRIASALILVRAIESVSVSTQRAFEQYGRSVQINTAVRLLTLGSAAVLALAGQRTVSILIATSLFLIAGTCLQFQQLRNLLGPVSLWPSFQIEETKVLLKFGVFVWLQALGGIIFGQLDRILLGISLGALAVAPYSICVQFAHPIYGVAVSGLSFLFPYLSQRATTISRAALRRTVLKAFLCNLLLVSVGAGILLLAGNHLLQIWAGTAVARSATQILPAIVLGSALMGLSVTGTYAMGALGLFREVALIGLAGRTAMLLLMVYLLHHLGLRGLGIARIFYGSIALLLYLPLLRRLSARVAGRRHFSSVAVPYEVQEGSKP